MVRSDSASGDDGGTDRGVNRRTVLQVLGTGAVASVGLVGTARGHWVTDGPVFCGCSQVCVCVEGDADVLMAQENEDGDFDVGFVVGDGELDPYPTGDPRYNGNFCVSTDDEGVPDGKIIGLQVAGTRWVNPNQCAQAALEAEQEQLASTHPRPEGDSGGPCGKPPCEHPGGGKGDDDTGEDDDDTGAIQVTWEDCETVSLSGPDEDLEEIVVHYMRCFEDPGEGCPDGAQLSIEDPALPMTIGRDELAVGDEEIRIDAVELIGDVEPDDATPPDDLDCGFESPAAVGITFEDCETVSLDGPDDDLEKIDLSLIRCFDDDSTYKTDLDGSSGCPTGHIVTLEEPELPLTLGRDDLALGDEQYFIDAVDLFDVNGVHVGTAVPPEDLDCSFESIGDEINIEFEMDDQTITLTEDEDPVSEVTVTGTAEFGYAGFGDDGPVDHAFINVWAQSDTIDTGGVQNSDQERYFDVDSDTDVVRNDVEITFDVPPEVGDPAPGEAIETEILGVGFFGLEEGTDPEESTNIGDWRDNDPMTLRVDREADSAGAGDIEVSWWVE